MFFNLDFVLIALRIPALLLAITVHEFAHARMAYRFGDQTAKSQGRMSLNPLHHLDPVGTIMILFFGFGWAKPVPINPARFTDYRRGLRWVSFAGPLANFILSFFSLLFLHLLLKFGIYQGLFFRFIVVLTQLNILLAIFNLIPVPPLDGSKIVLSFLSSSYINIYRKIEAYAPLVLIILVFTGAFRYIITPPYNWVFNFYSWLIGLLPGF